MKPAATLAPLLGALALALPLPALADEMWTTSWGQMAWEADLGETAVLTVAATDTEPTLRLFVQGLARDVMGGRGSYIGVWMADRRDGGCAVRVVDPVGGKSTAYWGTFRITFVDEGFPSAWSGVWGECVDVPANAFSGQPAHGD
jgi:hypothetical protein